MDDWLIDDDNLGLARRSVLPGEGFFYPDSLEREREETDIASAIVGAETVVVADTDADGLGCVALIREVHDGASIVPSGPHELRRSLEWVAEYAEPDATVYVCDLCPDDTDDLAALETLVDGRTIRWFDHHQWDTDVARIVRESGVDLVVGESGEVCTTDVALTELDAALPDRFVELAAVTRDHDLWIKDDPRSDDVADYAMWIDAEAYVATVREHGPDLPPEAEEFLAEKRVEKEALIEKAVGRAQFRDVGEWTVGLTYGRCSQNEVAEALRQEGADAAVVVKPAGSASLRGTESFERCHEVAARVNGGGHPRAAGCKPRIYDDMLDYAHHWTTQGAVAKQVILDAFEGLPPEDEDGGETES